MDGECVFVPEGDGYRANRSATPPAPVAEAGRPGPDAGRPVPARVREGSPVSGADLASGISAVVDLRTWSFINVDLTVVLWRAPSFPWVRVDAATRVGPAGTGSALATLCDADGPFGSCAQNLVFEPRAPRT
jgi:hypothetical protein